MPGKSTLTFFHFVSSRRKQKIKNSFLGSSENQTPQIKISAEPAREIVIFYRLLEKLLQHVRKIQSDLKLITKHHQICTDEPPIYR